MASVSLKGITKRFGRTLVLNDLNLEIADREFLVLVGPSGCGKTTTLRMISGLEDITEGEIYIGDRLINRVDSRDRNIALVFQNYALYPHMKVFDNIGFGLKMRKVPKEERGKMIKKTAEILRIEHLLDRKPKQLSGGEQQRVALGRAIVRQPSVFLFDEPLSNLDAKLRVQMRTELKKMHQELQTTTIYVTHDQVEAITLGDRVVVMKDGITQQMGIPQELYDRPVNLFVAGFLGSPAMNFIPCRLLEENPRIYIDTGDFRIPLSDTMAAKVRSAKGGEFIFGIRPEDLYQKTSEQEPSIDWPIIRVKINIVEFHGKDVSLSVSTGAHTLTVCLPADTDAKPHQDIDLVLNMKKSHLFRREGGETIV